MDSFLYKIEDYIRSNGISLSSFYLDKELFPEYFNIAVLERVSEISGKNIEEVDISGYTLMFTNGIAYLVIESNLLCKSLSYVISNKSDRLVLEDSYMIYEQELIKRADRITNIMLTHLKGSYHSKEVLAYYNVDERKMVEQLNDSVNKCIQCIDYVDKEYRDKLLEEMRDSFTGIYYQDIDKVNGKNVNQGNGTGSFKERVNEVIPVKDRLLALENYQYLYKDYAYNDTSNGINYLCYLYQIDYEKYVLILESYSGINYTKVIVFNKSDEVTNDEFLKLAKYYLELPYDESLRIGGEMIRLAHTSLSVFENNMAFFINGGVKGIKVNNKLKKRANELINLRR